MHRRTIKNAPFMFAVLKGGWTAALQLGRLLQSTLLFKHAEVSTTVESPLSWCQPRFLAIELLTRILTVWIQARGAVIVQRPALVRVHCVCARAVLLMMVNLWEAIG